MNLNQFLPVLDLILVICLFIGGAFAMRSGFASKSGEMQERAIIAQNAQIETQAKQIKSCEREIARLQGALGSLETLLKHYALRIEVNGETVTLVDEGTKQARTVQIRIEKESEP